MRSLKKLLAVIVAICVLATFTLPAFAADPATYANAAQAQKLYDMGLYAGTSTSVFTPDLGSVLTREQGMVLLLKMFGQLDAANAMTDADVTAALAAYTDADKLSSWAKKAMAYVVKNSISAGTSATTVGPKATLTGNQFATLILKQAGYTVADWTKAAEELTTKGVTGAAAFATTQLKRDDFVGIAFGALTIKNAAGKTIIAALVEAGKVTSASAVAAGVYSAAISATVAQTGAKTLTVTFNRALTAAEKTAATFTVKKGLVPYPVTATWAADDKSVVLAYQYNLLAGAYTVAVGGIEAPVPVTVTAAALTKIELTDAYLPLKDNLAIGFKVYNQFNEDMKVSAATIGTAAYAFSMFNATAATVVTDATAADADLIAKGRGATTAVVDDSIIITITNISTGISVSKTLKVKADATAATMSFGAVQPLKDTTRISVNNAGLVIPYTFTDQYGAAYKLPTHAADGAADPAALDNATVIGGITFMTSNAAVVDPDTFVVADGVLKFTAGATAGTAIITALVPTTGASAIVSITTNAVAALGTFVISEPAALVVAGEKVVIPYQATDSFGAAIAQKDFAAGFGTGAGQVNLVSSNGAVIDATVGTGDFAINADTKALELTPSTAGTATVYVYVNGALQNSVTFTVNAAAVATSIQSIAINKVFQVGATRTIAAGDVKIVDQYARPFTINTANLTITSSGAAVGVGGLVLTAAGTAGTATLTFTVDDLVAGTTNPAIDVAVSVIATADIKGYSIAAIKTLYKQPSDLDQYDVAVTLDGVDASGNKVTLVSTAPTFVTTSNAAIVAIDGTSVQGAGVGTATVSAWVGAVKVASVDVTVSDAAPVATTVAWSSSTPTLAAGTSATTLVTVKDQYGVVITPTIFFAGGTRIGTDGATTDVAGTHATTVETITVITSNGLTATAKVSITDITA